MNGSLFGTPCWLYYSMHGRKKQGIFCALTIKKQHIMRAILCSLINPDILTRFSSRELKHHTFLQAHSGVLLPETKISVFNHYKKKQHLSMHQFYFTRSHYKVIQYIPNIIFYNIVLCPYFPKFHFQLYFLKQIPFKFPVFSSAKLVLSTLRRPRLLVHHPWYPCQPLRNLFQERPNFLAPR